MYKHVNGSRMKRPIPLTWTAWTVSNATPMLWGFYLVWPMRPGQDVPNGSHKPPSTGEANVTNFHGPGLPRWFSRLLQTLHRPRFWCCPHQTPATLLEWKSRRMKKKWDNAFCWSMKEASKSQGNVRGLLLLKSCLESRGAYNFSIFLHDSRAWTHHFLKGLVQE